MGGKASVLDRITRTCYNNSNAIIAVQYFVVKTSTVNTADGAGRNLVREDSLSSSRFKRTGSISLERTAIYHTSTGGGGSKTVDHITTTGAFDEHNHGAGGDTEIITYYGKNLENDLTFNLKALSGVFEEGDVF